MTGKYPPGYGGGGGGSSGSSRGGGYGYGGSGGGGGGNAPTVTAQNVYDALRSGASASQVSNALSKTANGKEVSGLVGSMNAQVQANNQAQQKIATNQAIQQQTKVAQAQAAQTKSSGSSSSKSTSSNTSLGAKILNGLKDLTKNYR